MRYYKTILTLFLLFVPYLVFGGTKGKIAGSVIDKQNKSPLPGVNVIIKDTQIGAATDINGEYFIINIPAGTYTVEFIYVGYKTVIVENVRIQADLTTRLDFELEPSIMELEDQIVVIAKRPIIQQDLTSSRTIMNSKELEAIPFEDVQNIVNITPGVVDGNFRGGRDGETLYQIDGVTTMDPMFNNFDTDIPEFAIEEISVITGGFSAEYGNAQSGVVNMVVKEGGPIYNGSIRYKTSDYGKVISDWTDVHALQNFEFSFGGPEPLTNLLFNTYKNKIKFFFAGEWRKDNGRFPKNYDKAFNIQTKVSWTPNKENKITFSYLGNWNDQGNWNNRWRRITYEDKNPALDPEITGNEELASWWNNGQMDTEDLNHNGFLDPGEDINGNNEIDSEDLNHNGSLDEYNMLDHLPYFEQRSDNMILSWTYQAGPRSFFEAKLSRYRTSMKYNIKENINEDTDGDGHLDLYDAVNNIDLDGDGDYRHEDLNGNGIWDWKVDGGDTDLFTDENNNGYIDASEDNPREQWIHWTQTPKTNTQDNDGFYTYGNGLTYNRAKWNFDEKFTYALKLAYYNQINKFNELKLGLEGQYFDMKDHDVDIASGGNVYGQNITAYPYSIAAFVEDKMEYEGMILNAGLRFDYFQANSQTPADHENPFTLSEETGNLAYNNVKDTEGKIYFSPRLGISHPITDNDVIYFNYGRYFQLPQFRHLYTNSSFQLVGAFPIIGNPDMDPEITTSYEVGLKHSFSDVMKIEVKGFFKDIQGLTESTRFYYTDVNWAAFSTNTDYGNIRGFEIQLYKRFSRYWGGTINYTYSIAKGKSSNSRQNYTYAWAGNVIPTDENYLNWDQRHTINANINMRLANDENLFGTSVFNDMGANFVFQYGSGLPYTSVARDRVPPINDKRRPATWDLDMVIDKRFAISNRNALKFFIWANNLLEQWFNHVNIVGIADVNYYDGDQDGDGKPDRDPTGPYNTPAVYSEGTTWRVGVQFDF